MKLAVPGGLGFIGHHFCARVPSKVELEIIDSEYVTQLDRDRGPALIEERSTFIKNCRSQWHRSIRSDSLHSSLMSPAHTVAYFAGPSHSRLLNKNLRYFSQVMVTELTECIQYYLSKGDLQRFVYISSSMVYGDFESADENHPCQPTDIYGTLKLAGERIVQEYASRYGFEYVIVRPTAVYGPRDYMGRAIEKWTNAALTNRPLTVNGNNASDFTYVDDTVDGIYRAVTSPLAANQVFNISYGEKVTLEECAREIVKQTGSSSQIVVGARDQMPLRGNLICDRARVMLGYDPKVNISEGLKRYISYIVNHKKTVANPIHMFA